MALDMSKYPLGRSDIFGPIYGNGRKHASGLRRPILVRAGIWREPPGFSRRFLCELRGVSGPGRPIPSRGHHLRRWGA